MSVPLLELKDKRSLDKNANFRKYDINLPWDSRDGKTCEDDYHSICGTTTTNGLSDITITNSFSGAPLQVEGLQSGAPYS